MVDLLLEQTSSDQLRNWLSHMGKKKKKKVTAYNCVGHEFNYMG